MKSARDIGLDDDEHTAKRQRVEESRAVEKDSEEIADDNEKNGCCVFVSGLSNATNEKVLLEFFGSYGDVRECDIVQRDMGGIGFVEFVTKQSAQDALRATGSFIDGMKISVQHKKSPGGAAPKTGRTKSKSLFVKFMDGKIPSIKDIRGAFEVCGGIKDIRLHSSKVYCFIEFHTYEAAAMATQLKDPRFQAHYSTQQVPQYEGNNATTIAAAQISKNKAPVSLVPRNIRRKKPAT
eukprot:TRINITY_DN24510_c0_g1_i1.p1 TRINITY_DN24510_c0_g1~~TRINITY_DN24510_c0_g1_i1.p1  ORF type:complete len:237 (+),score=70.34 TRINITY_DN24510_c0_g1_i1:58-768(+)